MLNENLRNYEQEKQWLNSPYNKTIAYIPDKCITQNDDGEYSFYFITDIEFFVYGMDMDEEFLLPLHQLDERELKWLEDIKSINQILHPMKLNAVYLRKNLKVDYLVFCHDNNPNCFYSVKLEDYPKITHSIVEILLQYTHEMSIRTPYTVALQNSMITVNGDTHFYV